MNVEGQIANQTNVDLIDRPDRSQATEIDRTDGLPARLDVHVVILNNYLRPHHVAVFRELAKRVRKLTVLLSVPMEPDRQWDAEWDDLDVRIQKNWMWTTSWKHSSGFAEPNFIHIPIDTIRQLRQLEPDVILSYEMGFRTLLSSVYRLFHRKSTLVMVGNMSEHIERERGWMRRMLRKVICAGVDCFTYNGPSCRRYLESLSIEDQRLFHFPYCIDDRAVSDRTANCESADAPSDIRRMLYCGSISERKGILQFVQAMMKWCAENPQRSVRLELAGGGPLEEEVRQCELGNLEIELLGNCNQDELREAYARTNVCVFPTLADEWGLVPIEAMASGVPVLGSIHAQSVEAVCVESQNGWVFDPVADTSMADAIERCMQCTNDDLIAMGRAAKQSVEHITPGRSAELASEMLREIRRTGEAVAASGVLSRT